ncbi:MAG: HlyD family efflux transporter periplasmic adaptor subunit [Gammaproteobacteria bacterium]|jgi:putative peptide zinc metalloprotease protein|nr:HlyD family efflux transporter periplasmic adaptor subunit [Gammaproteobacteria bacterium]
MLTPETVPALREELRLLPATPQPDGSPAWHVLDPVRNRFFRIGWLEFELLCRWALGRPEAIARAVAAETTLAATADDVAALAGFLDRHALLAPAGPRVAEALAGRARRQRGAWWQRAVHQYLFFRVPLVFPQARLADVARRLRWAWSPAFLGLSAVAGAVGLWLLSRQWDSVLVELRGAFQGLGWVGFAAALALSKTLHEVGHAVTAARHGVRVGHMGVAFVVLLPMLYTDTGESWKLLTSRARLRIAAAGLTAELTLAAWATLAWALLPDGALRQATLFLATSAWVVSVAVNASPFMRFDGYFLLSDALDLPNLHERAGALARARLRRVLLGLPEPDPESFAPGTARALTLFAWTTWLYRAVVFFGIALLVYHLAFKLLGIALFLIEVVWLILRPVWRELTGWWRLRTRVPIARRLALLAFLGGLAALLLLPWQTGVRADGWLHAEQRALHAPQPAWLETVAVRAGERVAAGQLLFTLRQPALEDAGRKAAIMAEAFGRQAAGFVGVEGTGTARAQLAAQLAAEWRREAAAKHEEAERLRLAAPFAGTVLDLDPDLRPGAWVGVDTALAWLVDERTWRAEVLVEEAAVGRIRTGQAAKVYPAGSAAAPWPARVIAVDPARLQALPHPLLDARHGGPVRVEEGRDKAAKPRAALFRVVLTLEAPPARRVQPITAVIEAEPQSLIGRWAGALVATLIRESGF